MLRFRSISHDAFIVRTHDDDLDVTVGRRDTTNRIVFGMPLHSSQATERVVGFDRFSILQGMSEDSRQISAMVEGIKSGLINSSVSMAGSSALSFMMGFGFLNPIALSLGVMLGAASGGMQSLAIDRAKRADYTLDCIGRMARRFLDSDEKIEDHWMVLLQQTGTQAFELGGDILKVFVAFHRKLVNQGKVEPW